MHVHLAVVEQPRGVQQLDLGRALRARHRADVRGDHHVELARQADLGAGHVERHEPELGQRDAHVEQAAVAEKWRSRTRRASASRSSGVAKPARASGTGNIP